MLLHLRGQVRKTKKSSQDIYTSQEETASSPSSGESEDEVRGKESSEKVYPHEEGDLLMVRRLLGGQSCNVSHIYFAFLQFETIKYSSMPNAEVIIFFAFKLY